jgi:hypothetical protein
MFFKKDNNADEYLNKLVELKLRYEDSTKSGFTESNKLQLLALNKEIDNLYLKKFKNEENLTDIGNTVTSSIDQSKKLDTTNRMDTNNRSERVKTEQVNIEELKSALQSRVFKSLRDITINEDQYQFVSIDLEKIIKQTNESKYDVQLQEGDILYIPTFNETVGVSGDVLYPIVMKYIQGNSLKDYVNYAGGFNNTALKGRSYVVEANGVVKRTHRFFGFKFYPKVSPGSQVFVPKNNEPKSNFSVDRLLGVVSSIVTTYLLVTNLTK